MCNVIDEWSSAIKLYLNNAKIMDLNVSFGHAILDNFCVHCAVKPKMA